jgi:aspartate/methionine/tyrosine aminotransferase
MERTQCLYEHTVEFNLSESGVTPLRAGELIDGMMDPEDLLATRLAYPAAGGTQELRERIAEFHGAKADNIRVTNGSSEANFMQFWAFLERGDRAAIMIPNYLQTWGLARHFAGRADAFRLVVRKEDGHTRWALDTDSLHGAVTRKTKLILVTNPNNPTGAVLDENEMNAIISEAERVGAWIVADEVYRGAEVEGPLSPTFWGRYPRVLITSGLSKAFGLPGLRIGWIVGPPKTVAWLESYHDYLTLTPTMLSDRLATIAMHHARRQQLILRTQNIIRSQLPKLEDWIAGEAPRLTHVRPQAGAIAMIRYDFPMSSTQLFDRLRKEKSVLITPGSHFGLAGKYFRVGFGYDIDRALRGLRRISRFFSEL